VHSVILAAPAIRIKKWQEALMDLAHPSFDGFDKRRRHEKPASDMVSFAARQGVPIGTASRTSASEVIGSVAL
jgi:hypothetical protein